MIAECFQWMLLIWMALALSFRMSYKSTNQINPLFKRYNLFPIIVVIVIAVIIMYEQHYNYSD